MEGRTTVMLAVETTSDGRIAIRATPSDDRERITVDGATLVLTYWSEDQGIVRGRLQHPETGVVAYFQSSKDSLRELAAAINLAIVPLPAR